MENFKSEKISINEQVSILNDSINSLFALAITGPSNKENLIETLKLNQPQFIDILSELDDTPSLNLINSAMEFSGSNALGLEKRDLPESKFKTNQLQALGDLAFN